MAPAANSVSATPKSNRNLNGDYQVVAWDLDTTGILTITELYASSSAKLPLRMFLIN